MFVSNQMIDFKFCFLFSETLFKNTIQCFEEENKMKIFFSCKIKKFNVFV